MGDGPEYLGWKLCEVGAYSFSFVDIAIVSCCCCLVAGPGYDTNYMFSKKLIISTIPFETLEYQQDLVFPSICERIFVK